MIRMILLCSVLMAGSVFAEKIYDCQLGNRFVLSFPQEDLRQGGDLLDILLWLSPLHRGGSWFIKMEAPYISGKNLAFLGTIYGVDPSAHVAVFERVLQKIKQRVPSLSFRCLGVLE